MNVLACLTATLVTSCSMEVSFVGAPSDPAEIHDHQSTAELPSLPQPDQASLPSPIPLTCAFSIEKFQEENLIAGSNFLSEFPNFSTWSISWHVVANQFCDREFDVKLYEINSQVSLDLIDLSTFTPLYHGSATQHKKADITKEKLGFYDLTYLLAVSYTDITQTAHLDVVASDMHPYDITLDGKVTALDALQVTNHMSRYSESANIPIKSKGHNYDANRDGAVTALDSLVIINHLRRQSNR